MSSERILNSKANRIKDPYRGENLLPSLKRVFGLCMLLPFKSSGLSMSGHRSWFRKSGILEVSFFTMKQSMSSNKNWNADLLDFLAPTEHMEKISLVLLFLLIIEHLNILLGILLAFDS